MDKYENTGVVGEGSYGVVMKCRHRETGQMVAIKKFLETDEDPTVKKIAMREIRMLKVRNNFYKRMLSSYQMNITQDILYYKITIFLQIHNMLHVKYLILKSNPLTSNFQRLRHENLINLIEVFRKRRKLYLVFEYVDHTVLEELEDHPKGLPSDTARSHIYQVLKGIEFCHQNNVSNQD